MNDKTKILQINTVYGIKSTGLICRDIEVELEGDEFEFHMAHSTRSNISPKREYIIGNAIDRKMHSLASRITGLQGYFSAQSTRKLIEYIQSQKIDIVHLHNIHSNNVNLGILLMHLASKKIKTIINLHDCWFYTGKCMYYAVLSCEKWKTKCNNCPQLKEDNPSWFFDATPKLFADKLKWFNQIENLAVVGVSDWITNDAKLSLLRSAKIIKRIYNWVDTDLYRPRQETASIKLNIGLSDKDFLIIAVASKWTIRKGIDFLIECARDLSTDTRLLVVGHIDSDKKLPSNCIHIEETHDLNFLASLYAAADVFINFSMEETFGKVTAEAMSCGTPVVVMNSTANPELVGFNCGHVVARKDKALVFEAINKIKSNTKSFYSEHCRKHVEINFDKSTILKQYERLYKEVASC